MAGDLFYIPSRQDVSRLTPAFCCTKCGVFVAVESWDDHLAEHRRFQALAGIVQRLDEAATPPPTQEGP